MPEVGSVVRLRNFRHYVAPNPDGPQHGDPIWMDYTIDKAKVFVMLYLGAENKDGSDPLKPETMLNYLGFERSPSPVVAAARQRALEILHSTVDHGGLCTPGANRSEILELIKVLEAGDVEAPQPAT